MAGIDTKAGSHANDYRSGIRSAISGLWSGVMDRAQFLDVIGGVIDRGLRFAFAEGAAEYGVTPEDYTEAETRALNDAIISEYEHTGDLADAVEAGSKKNGGKRQPLYDRAEMWVARYADVAQRSKILAGADKKFKWVLGPTEHCPTCASLAGITHRGSQWRNYVMPREVSDLLCCGGFRCQCSLQETTDRASRKYPPVPGDCTTKAYGP